MITSYVDESPTKKVFTFEVPADDVRKATDRTVKAFAKQVRLPGFRPGKVPPEMIKRRFAEEVKGEVLEHLIQATVGEALREKHLVPLGKPKIGDLKFAFEEPLSFRVDLEVRPAVEPKDYRGLKVPAGSWTSRARSRRGTVRTSKPKRRWSKSAASTRCRSFPRTCATPSPGSR